MLAVTEAAGVCMADMLSQGGFPEEIGIRLVQEERGITMHPDCERAGDKVISLRDRVVLVLDAQMSKRLEDGTLDVEGRKLTLIRPPKNTKAEKAEEEKIDCQKHWL